VPVGFGKARVPSCVAGEAGTFPRASLFQTTRRALFKEAGEVVPHRCSLDGLPAKVSEVRREPLRHGRRATDHPFEVVQEEAALLIGNARAPPAGS
jgi:hypothetical protein